MEKLRHDPYTLPAGFQWDTLNLDDPLVVSCLAELKSNWFTKFSSNKTSKFKVYFNRAAIKVKTWKQERYYSGDPNTGNTKTLDILVSRIWMVHKFLWTCVNILNSLCECHLKTVEPTHLKTDQNGCNITTIYLTYVFSWLSCD